MTTSVTDAASGPYFTNGVTTDFPFTFKIAASDEVAVFYLNEDGSEETVSPAAYAVTIGVDGEGGTAIFTAPPAADARELWVRSDPSFEQQILFEDEGPFNSSVLNPLADRGAIRDIWLRDRALRAMTLPLGETFPPLPNAMTRAGKYLAFDSLGVPVVVEGFSSLLDLYSLVSSEDIGLGDFVNIHSVGGNARLRLARANDPEREAHGFATSVGISGFVCMFQFAGLNVYQVPGAFAQRLYLSDSDPGQATEVPPSAGGSIIQMLGVGIPGVGIRFDRREAIIL